MKLFWRVVAVVTASVAALLIAFAPMLALAGTNEPSVRRGGDFMNGSLYWKNNARAFVYYPDGTMGSATGFVKAPYPFSGSAQGMFFAGADTQFYSNSSLMFQTRNSTNSYLSEVTAGGFEQHGDTKVNVEAQTPTAGYGAINYDTTGSKLRAYEGGAWKYVNTSTLNGPTSPPIRSIPWSAIDGTGVAPETQNFIGGVFPNNANSAVGNLSLGFGSVACNWSVPGVGGTNVTVRIIDTTTGNAVCKANVGTCTQTAFSGFTPAACVNADGGASSAIAGNTSYAMQLDSATDCGTNPTFVGCTLTFFSQSL